MPTSDDRLDWSVVPDFVPVKVDEPRGTYLRKSEMMAFERPEGSRTLNVYSDDMVTVIGALDAAGRFARGSPLGPQL